MSSALEKNTRDKAVKKKKKKGCLPMETKRMC